MFSALFVTLLLATSADAELRGAVVDSAGQPIAGARVDIYTAKPRTSVGVVCPSCYLDCDKWTTTDEKGRFAIADLDPLLLFRVLVMRDGLRPELTEHLDPAKDEPAVTLRPLPTGLPPERVLRGQVVDPQGKPVVGAVVEPWGAKTHDRRWWGSMPGVDPAAVTDRQGRFVLTSRDPKLAMDLQVRSPNFAVALTPLLDMGDSAHPIRLQVGAAISGRIMHAGRGLPGRVVGAVQADRSSQGFVGAVQIATDEEGRFQFDHLQPSQSYFVYTLCDGQTPGEALAATEFTTPGEGQSHDLGPLEAKPGLTLAGHIELPPEEEFPGEASVTLFRDPAWNHCTVKLASDGRFKFVGLPSEVFQARVNVPSFRLDASKLRFQSLGDESFGLRLREDRLDLVIPLMRK